MVYPWEISIEDGTYAAWLQANLKVIGQIEATGINNTPIGDLTPTQGQFTDLAVDEIVGQLNGTMLNNQMVSKAIFDILSLMTDPRCLYMQNEDPEAGTLYDASGQGHDGTYQGSMTSGDRVKKGMGWALDFDGTDDYVNLGDDDDFSFGNGDNDEAVTWFGVMEVIDSGTSQRMIAKRDDTTSLEKREWTIYMGGTRLFSLIQFDESANVSCHRLTTVALSIGWHTWAITSPGDGGATAMDNVKIYIDGGLIASTATNNVSYVAMENLTTPCWIGASKGIGGTPVYFLHGNNALTGMDGSEWSAYDAHRFHQICKGLYGL